MPDIGEKVEEWEHDCPVYLDFKTTLLINHQSSRSVVCIVVVFAAYSVQDKQRN